MAEEGQTPPATPPTDAGANAGSNAAQPAAEAPPAWAAGLLDQVKQLRTGIGTIGQKVKDLETRPAAQPQYDYGYQQPAAYQPPAVDPWSQGIGQQQQTIAEMTPQQLDAYITQKARQESYATFNAGAEMYGLDRLTRQSALDGINPYRAEMGQAPLPQDTLQQYAPQIEAVLQTMTENPTPERAEAAARLVLAEQTAQAAAQAAAAGAAQAGESNDVSGALEATNRGSPGAPPAPDGSPQQNGPMPADPRVQTPEQRAAAVLKDYGGADEE
jgi:hypothetical protein